MLRTTRKEALDEPYRTMIGHMRHEIAHMLWWRLSLRKDFLDAFREMFGNEREDYPAALQRCSATMKTARLRIGKRGFCRPTPLLTPMRIGRKPLRTCCT